MPPQSAAANVAISDLGAYQSAARLVLTNDVITAARPRPGALELVLRWADQLAGDFRDHLGYTLVATTRAVRLIRRLDALDPTQTTIFTAKSGKPFDRRRLAYLCLVLASFQRSRVEVSLADLVRVFTPAANAIDGLGFDPTLAAHKAAVIDVLDWLAERGGLRLSDGSAQAWAQDAERGDALYDIDHDICATLFRPARPVQHLTSAAGLLDATFTSARRAAQREAAAQRAARALVEHPVVYYAQVEPEVAEALRQHGVAENLARLTGLAVERRAEGVLLADAGGRFTDRPFPGRGGAVNRAAGLLLAKIADILEDPGTRPALLPLPPDGADQRELLAAIDAALPLAGVVTELAWTVPPPAADDDDDDPERSRGAANPEPPAGRPAGEVVPFIAETRLRAMIEELYDEVGAASFTVTWQHDSRGLLAAAVAFLADLRLLRPVGGGVLVLPAAARYRNITLALPARRAGGQLDLFGGDFGSGELSDSDLGDSHLGDGGIGDGGIGDGSGAAVSGAAMSDRFKPTRAGVINVWDYVDEEWAFADGRLALRGHNGSGKTKALEVLFPFVLDGVADSRRLDPFSGENRTMKSNLLYRGQESEYGYAWMEFCQAGSSGSSGGPVETVTLIIGMRAHRNSDGVRTSFYVTAKRLGVDFGLLSADSRPLTERQLRAVLESDAWRRTATEYRDLVDARLFGLGRQRYAQLLDLLLALRRPLLAKDLDPAKVSDTLTSGLSPVDEDLVTQAARDFENLAAVRRLFDDLTAASAAVGEFAAHYAAYLRAHVKYALDRVTVRSAAAAAQAGQLAAAAGARDRAVAAELAAEAARDAAGAEGQTLQGRLDGLRNSEEYKSQGRIEDKRREVARRAQEVAAQRDRLGRDNRRVAVLAGEVAKLARRAADSRAAAGRHAADLADAAQRSGIADDGFGPVDVGGAADLPGGPADTGGAGDDPLTIARARLAARRDDISAIRQLLGAVRDARHRRGYAEQELSRKETAEQRQRAAAEEAAARLAESRAAAAAALSAWTARWAAPEPAPTSPLTPTSPASPSAPASLSAPASPSALASPSAPVSRPSVVSSVSPSSPPALVSPADATVLAEALDLIGEPGALGLAEVYDGLTADRQTATITARANLDAALRDARQDLAELRAERDAIAAEQDDAPPGSDLRPAGRDGRPGAPLWQLVRFAPDVPAATAAAIEGALYGAGLLTAWVHPDPALTRVALETAEADGYLAAPAALSPVHSDGRSMADVLLPEEQDRVPATIIAAVLRSIALTDDIMAPGSDIPARPVSRGVDYVFGDVQVPAWRRQSTSGFPVISARAQFSYGVHVGARPKEAPEYIGATNRASRRQARLAEQDALIARTGARCQVIEADLTAAADLLADFRRARGELPATRPIAAAADQAGRQAVLLAQARDDAGAARHALDAAVAEADARTRQLRHAAAERVMPTSDEGVDAIARAAAEFENAAIALHAERVTLAQAEGDLAERTETVSRQRLEYAEAEAVLADSERSQAAIEEEFRALEDALRHDVQQVLEQIRQTERLIRVAQQSYDEHDRRAREEHDQATDADAQVRVGRQALADAIAALHDEAARFGDLARSDLRPVVGVSMATPWPDPANWPPPERASDELTATLTGRDDAWDEAVPAEGDGAPDPDSVLRAVLPPGAADVLDAFAVAVKGGRAVTEGALKNTADRMSIALKDFTDALAACEEDYRVDWEPGAVVTVHVIDDEGRKPVARFADRTAERAADQGILLEERERKVLEDELLAALAAQIHARVLAARDLTRDMNADTRSKPMSSGLAVGIRWAQADKITDAQRAASRLLDRDSPGPERLAQLRGVLRDMIRGYRAAHPRATYREALASVLDYRSWHAFELVLITPGEGEQRLTRAKHSVMSGGEKSAAIHLPLFAAANALYSSAKEHCPRLIALDEAFVGIDERYKPDLFGLAVKFDLDLFMTGHDLWVTARTVPMIAHYDLYHDKVARATSALLILWDGRQLIDASAGFSDNEALVTELLGLRPTRHAPLAAATTLYAPAPDPGHDPDDDPDD